MSNTTALYQTCNLNITDSSLCTPETCCLAQGEINYLPSLGGNAAYAAIFGILLLSSLLFGIRYRTTSFTIWMSLGLAGEIVGYVGRVMLHNNIFDFNAFLTYLIPLTISPAFLTACIYLCLARIIYITDPNLAYTRLKPMTYTSIFVTFDVISLVLQGAGGGVAATADDKKGSDLGVNIMIAGLAFQVVSLVIFIALCSDFTWRLYRGSRYGPVMPNITVTDNDSSYDPGNKNYGHVSTGPHASTLDSVRCSKMFKGFIIALAVATVLILIRSSYRLAELQGGFNGALANDEVLFMILEGPMIILSVLLLTVFHPGFCLGKRGLWSMKAFQGVKGRKGEKDAEGETKLMAMTPSRSGSEEDLNRDVRTTAQDHAAADRV